MNEVFNRLTAWFALILCFTAEEAWQSRAEDSADSIHLHSHAPVPSEWHDDALGARWDSIRRVRQVVTSALETARNDGAIGASLQAAPTVHVSPEIAAHFDGEDAAMLFITSDAQISVEPAPEDAFRIEGVEDAAVVFALPPVASASCWKIMPEVTGDTDICRRCFEVECDRLKGNSRHPHGDPWCWSRWEFLSLIS